MSTTDTRFIEGTVEGSAILRTVYPEHIYDPGRRDIAAQIMGKEIAKLVAAEGNNELDLLRATADSWFDGSEVTQVPVRDFWSLFELLSLAKNKRLARFVTAANVAWQSEPQDIDGMVLDWMSYIESHPDIFGPRPWPIQHLRQAFDEHPALWNEAQESNAANISQYRFEHGEEPITIVETQHGSHLLDGNGRLYRAFMAGKQTVNCSVGRMDGPRPIDYWVSTGLLKNLCYDVVDNQLDNPSLSEAALTTLTHHLATNEVARINYELFLRDDFTQIDI